MMLNNQNGDILICIFFEHKVILPVTDDILRQTGGIKGLRERVQSVDGLYLSTEEDEIVVPFVYKRYDIFHLLNKLETKYNIKELRLIKETK